MIKEFNYNKQDISEEVLDCYYICNEIANCFCETCGIPICSDHTIYFENLKFCYEEAIN